MIKGFKIPNTTFQVRTGDSVLDDGCSFDEGMWTTVTTDDYFKGRRVVLFSLPGAFTPTCTSTQLPSFEENYNTIKTLGIDEVYCCSVNDTFVMNAWAEILKVNNVKVIPDGSGNFTRYMGMLIGKNHRGFGNRSWRYMTVINNGVVEAWWQEPGINNDGSDADPYIETTPEKMMAYLQTSFEPKNRIEQQATLRSEAVAVE